MHLTLLDSDTDKSHPAAPRLPSANDTTSRSGLPVVDLTKYVGLPNEISTLRYRLMLVLIVVALLLLGAIAVAYGLYSSKREVEGLKSDQRQLISDVKGVAETLSGQSRRFEEDEKHTSTLTSNITRLEDERSKLSASLDTRFDNLRTATVSIIDNRIRKQLDQRKSQTAVTVTAPKTGQPEVTDLSTTQASSAAVSHHHLYNMSIPLPPGILVHRNFGGEVGYWMVIRMVQGDQQTVRVMPFGTNALGVEVHSIEDYKDYIIPNSGGWLELLTRP
jgi:hypothetical protein